MYSKLSPGGYYLVRGLYKLKASAVKIKYLLNVSDFAVFSNKTG